MIGTLVGLVLMLKNLNDPDMLGPNMAVALLTTLYGSLLANMVFNPIAAKLEEKTESEIFIKQVMVEGIIGIQSGKIRAIWKASSSFSVLGKNGGSSIIK